jgi:hypothetical protein
MPTCEELIRLAKICARQARDAKDKDVAAFLTKMAMQYLAQAERVERAKSPDIGEPPRCS